jgi:hypothetical protein
MGDPLSFTHGPYSSFAQNRRLAILQGGGPYEVAGDASGTARYMAERMWPFLVPVVFLLLVRALDRRLLRVNSLSLVALSLAAPLGLITPLVYRGLSIGFLRFTMYPLFVAAGWGLFEIATSPRRRRAACLIFVSWIVAIGAALSVMSAPLLGAESEDAVLESVVTGKDARDLHYVNYIWRAEPIARFLEGPAHDGAVAADQMQAYAVVASLPFRDRDRVILTPDRRFSSVVADPGRFGVKYFLVPNPAAFPADAIVRARPRLWSGHEPGFRLVTDFPNDPTPEQWRVYAVVDKAAASTQEDHR